MCSKKSFSSLEVLKRLSHAHTAITDGFLREIAMQTQENGSSTVSRARGDESPVVPGKKKEEGSTSKQKQGYVSITPSYSRVSEKLRRISSGSLQCSLFCGGQRCKYENAGRWGEKDKALQGLFSHWVTDNILAMARPSTHIFEKVQLVEQFRT